MWSVILDQFMEGQGRLLASDKGHCWDNWWHLNMVWGWGNSVSVLTSLISITVTWWFRKRMSLFLANPLSSKERLEKSEVNLQTRTATRNDEDTTRNSNSSSRQWQKKVCDKTHGIYCPKNYVDEGCRRHLGERSISWGGQKSLCTWLFSHILLNWWGVCRVPGTVLGAEDRVMNKMEEAFALLGLLLQGEPDKYPINR